MQITALRLQNVRRFGTEGISIDELDPHLNVLIAPNEFGKSTLLHALQAAFFAKHSSNDQKTVGTLRPANSSASPYVEVDFETDEGAFQLRKRFARGKKDSMAELRQPNGAVLTGDDADGRLRAILSADKPQAGPVGLLWIGQGETLRSVITDDKTAVTSSQAETMASLLSEEVSAAAGQDDIKTVVQQAQTALKELETRTGKPTQKLAAALAEAERLRDELGRVTSEVERGGQLRAELRAQEDALAAVSDPQDEARRNQEREGAEKRAGEGPHLRTQIGHTEELLARERIDAETAIADLQSFKSAVNSLKINTDSESMAKTAQDDLSRKISHTQERRAAARAARGAAQEQARAHRQTLAAWQVFGAAEQKRAEAVRLGDDLKRAEQLLADLPPLEKEAARPSIDLEPMRQARRSLDAAEAKLGATAPQLLVRSGGPVLLDGESLEAGDAASVVGEGAIIVGETHLQLQIAGREVLRDEVERTRVAFAQMLEKAGVLSPEDAAAREEARLRAVHDLKHLKRELSGRAPQGLEALKSRVAELSKEGAEATAPALSAEEAAEALRSAERDETRAGEDEQLLADKLDGLSEKLAAAKVDLATAAREAQRLAETLGPEAQWPEREAALQKRIDDIQGVVAGRQHSLLEMNKALKEVGRAEADLRRLQEIETNRARRLREHETAIVRIQAQLAAFYEDGAEAKVSVLEQELAAAEERLAALELRRQALRLLLQLIAEEEEIRRETVIAPVMAVLNPMLEDVFGDAQLRFDIEWNPEGLQRSGSELPVKDLSAGTREQIAILTRLAFAKLMASQGQKVPVILDDALGYADDQRARRLFSVIREVAEVTQVIVLSCHDRIFSDLGGHPIEPKPFV